MYLCSRSTVSRRKGARSERSLLPESGPSLRKNSKTRALNCPRICSNRRPGAGTKVEPLYVADTSISLAADPAVRRIGVFFKADVDGESRRRTTRQSRRVTANDRWKHQHLEAGNGALRGG